MILGRRIPVRLEPVYVFFLKGQSNGVGRQDGSRIANTLYNYKGIGTEYPAQRVAQEQYTEQMENVIIYFKDLFYNDDQSVDDGVWEAYHGGVNSMPKTVTSIQYWGSELSCATQMQERTGKTVAIIKAAWNATGLTSTLVDSQAPGNWNNASRFVAVEYYLKRGVRDLRLLYPKRRLVFVAVNWWQGENDGDNNVPTATYETQFMSLKGYVDLSLQGLFVQQRGLNHIWNVTKLDFNRDAGEAAINVALQNLADDNEDVYIVDAGLFPQGDELTSAEANPVAVGNPNANGALDDNHSSYIAMLGIGELQEANIHSAGLT